MTNFKKFVTADEGQDLIEYGLLIGLISVVVIAMVKSVGTKVNGYFTTLNTDLT